MPRSHTSHTPHIIPAILAYSAEELATKIAYAQKKGAKELHIDVLDGKFVPHTSYITPARVKKVLDARAYHPTLEIHLMVTHPQKHLDAWYALGATRIIVHAEIDQHELTTTLTAIKKARKHPILAINPSTDIAKFSLIFPIISGIMLMGVVPGKGGQRFRPSVLKTCEYIKKTAPTLPIALDGGVRASNTAKIVAAGVSHLVAGSYFFDDV